MNDTGNDTRVYIVQCFVISMVIQDVECCAVECCPISTDDVYLIMITQDVAYLFFKYSLSVLLLLILL